jgi:hypothetical protein
MLYLNTHVIKATQLSKKKHAICGGVEAEQAMGK